MPKKTTILIVILAIITGILIYLAVKSDQSFTPRTTTNAPTDIPTIAPYASLAFATPQVDAILNQNQTIDIVIDTQGQKAATAQIELSFDPKSLTNVSFVKPTNPFFGADQNELINSVDATQGRASYAVGIPLQGSEKSGKGTVVTMKFRAVKASGITTSTISFLAKSAVTTLDSPTSILRNSAPLTVIVSE